MSEPENLENHKLQMGKVVVLSVTGALVGALALFLITKLGGDPRHVPQENYNLVVWIGTLMGLCSGAIVGAICGLASVFLGNQEPK